MGDLFEQRRRRHFVLLMKYWRLVFNDHFIIALFFLFGALAYTYAQMIAHVSPGQWWAKLFLTLWLGLIVHVGRLATLVEPADPVFLLPQTSSMINYFRRARYYSLIGGETITILATVVVLPLAMATVKLTGFEVGEIIASMVLLKFAHLILAQRHLSLVTNLTMLNVAGFGEPLVAQVITWWVSPTWGFVATIVMSIGHFAHLRVTEDADWAKAIRSERERMESVYRFFNLFTDVPQVQGKVKCRAWANGLINWLAKGNAWTFLYARGLVRNVELSGLIARLTALMMVVLFFVPLAWLNTALLVIGLYLIVTQLTPLADHFEAKVFTHVYPFPPKERQAAFIKVATKVAVVVAVLLAVASLGVRLDWQRAGINLVVALIEGYLLTRYYLKTRIH